VVVDTDVDIAINEEFRGSDGLWELLTSTSEKQQVTSDDLRTYKKISSRWCY